MTAFALGPRCLCGHTSYSHEQEVGPCFMCVNCGNALIYWGVACTSREPCGDGYEPCGCTLFNDAKTVPT